MDENAPYIILKPQKNLKAIKNKHVHPQVILVCL
jgi:hypothetical protein